MNDNHCGHIIYPHHTSVNCLQNVVLPEPTSPNVDPVHPTNIRCLLNVKVDFPTPSLPTSALSIKKNKSFNIYF